MKISSIAPIVIAAIWSTAALSAEVVPAAVAPMDPLVPPISGGPVEVEARLTLKSINEINEGTETFEFSAVLALRWHDPRQAFDPSVEGAPEKFYTGAYQFNEISPAWYPQVVLTNDGGGYASTGVSLRIEPDGTSTLTESFTAIAETSLNMRRFPFDAHRLEAVFEVLGHGHDEVVLRTAGKPADPQTLRPIPQWRVEKVEAVVRDRPAPYAGKSGVASSLVIAVEVQRDSFYLRRLITFPLAVIVMLSFSVFWMDRSSLGDRTSVSFIGILTGVAYQLVLSDKMPQISYMTLIHGFLNLCFLTMSATVIINLVVGALDRRGKHDIGDLVDRRCRWLFPAVFFGLVLVLESVAYSLF